MPKKMQDCEYFVSFCLMTENTNPFGHAFLMFSQLDPQQGSHAQVEVIGAVGFFSRYMPVLGYKPISRGRVKEEEFAYIADKNGMYHKTFPITQDEMGALLAAINQDRRMVGNEPPSGKNQPDKPGGPIFNLFKGKNCKFYGLEKLAEIGLDVKSLRGWGLEIPKMTQDVLPLKVVKKQQGEKTFYCWETPLVPQERKMPNSHRNLKNYQQFHILQQTVNKIDQLLTQREAALKQQGRHIPAITKTKEKVQKIKNRLTQLQAYPKKMLAKTIAKQRKELNQAVKVCTTSLNKQGIELNLVSLLVDALKEMYYRMRYGLTFSSGRDMSVPNSRDKFMLEKIKSEQKKMALR